MSNPKLVGTSLHFRSPSMVFGHPITLVFMFFTLTKMKIQNFEGLHMIVIRKRKMIMLQNNLVSNPKFTDTTVTAYRLIRILVLPEVLGKEARVCVGIVPSNDQKSIQIKLLRCFFSLLNLKSQKSNAVAS